MNLHCGLCQRSGVLSYKAFWRTSKGKMQATNFKTDMKSCKSLLCVLLSTYCWLFMFSNEVSKAADEKDHIPTLPVCRYVQVLCNHIAQQLGVGLVLLPSDFANAVEAAESAGIRGAPKGHHLIRYDVHSYVLQ